MKHTSIIFVVIILLGCQTPFETVETTVDHRLFGEWYRVDVSPMSFPGPESVYRGWSISADGSMRPVGIEGSSGKIGLIETKYAAQIHYAKNGLMVVDYWAHPNLVVDSVKYSIEGGKLILDGSFIEGAFNKTHEGAVATSPAPSMVSVAVDGVFAENLSIANRVPSAFISKISGTELRLRSEMDGQRMVIYIKQYNGPGAYVIGKNDAAHMRFGTDWLEPPNYTDADSSGIIIIDDCDLTALRCLGNFEFTTGLLASQEDPHIVRHLTEGIFDVPVFQ